MAEAEVTEKFNCTAEEFFKLVVDFEKYPEFLSDIKSVKMLKNGKKEKEMEFSVSIIKTIKYKIIATQKASSEVDFHFTEGDIFKSMTGSWRITDLAGGKCKVKYTIEASFGLLVPGVIAKTLVSVNLPSMMENFKKRVKDKYKK